MTVAERIRQRRMYLSISQTVLAEMVGITKQQMYKYENGIITNEPALLYDRATDVAKWLQSKAPPKMR